MKIKLMETDRNWMYLWGKSVEDVDLNQHCARSLKGVYDNHINKNMKKIAEIEIEGHSRIFYICGVSEPYRWKENFHLAMIESKGDILEVNRNGIHIIVQDAIELPILFDVNDCTHPKRLLKQFSTCRNWQFAYQYQDIIKEQHNVEQVKEV